MHDSIEANFNFLHKASKKFETSMLNTHSIRYQYDANSNYVLDLTYFF